MTALMLRRSIGLSLLLATPGFCYDGGGFAKVTRIDVTYMPSQIPFLINAAIAGCPAGSWIRWSPATSSQLTRDENAQTVLTALLSAKVSDKRIYVYIRTSGCIAEYLYLMD